MIALVLLPVFGPYDLLYESVLLQLLSCVAVMYRRQMLTWQYGICHNVDQLADTANCSSNISDHAAKQHLSWEGLLQVSMTKSII